MKLNIQKIKIFLITNLSLILLFIGLGALIRAINSVTIQKMVFEIIGFYISIFAFHFSNSILKDYIREVKTLN